MEASFDSKAVVEVLSLGDSTSIYVFSRLCCLLHLNEVKNIQLLGED